MALMDELAARGITSEDLEKAASARLFEQAAAAEGIDLDTLNDSQINELYDVWANGDAGEAKTASAGEIEEAHAKLAEAEILGRHMARAYMDELGGEDAGVKIARARWKDEADKKSGKPAAEGGTKRPQGGNKRPLAGLAATEKEMAGKASANAKTQAARTSIKDFAKSQAERVTKPAGKAALTIGRALGVQGRRAAKLTGGAAMAAPFAAAGAAGAAGLAAHHMRSKESSAFDELAAERALAILEANGLGVSEAGEVVKVSDSGDVTIEDAVDAGAWELLAELGFTQAE